MEALFYIVPLIMIAGAVFMLYRTLGRARQVSAAWNSGITAEGRCLRAYTSTSGGGGDTSVHTTLHHVYEFTTRDGRPFRFDEGGGPGTTVEGDIVTVYYTPDRPESATALTPGRGRLLAGTGCLVAFFAVFIAFCVFFMVTAHWIFAETDDFMP
ncbi:DUF3592 domain-containing protein [Streptomyces sp. NPDC006872]|uniref:DUF3592 domain-containing protein n=1 Tax=Streptomyces sp. NPDC006872 TaxID=3155720 RepID=UPI0033BFD1BB